MALFYHMAKAGQRQALSLLLLLMLLGLRSAWAQTTTVAKPIESLRIESSLNDDGSLAVTQHIQFASPDKLSWQLFTNARGLTVTADSLDLKGSDLKVNRSGNKVKINTDHLARAWQISYQTTTTLIRHNQSNQVFFQVLQNSGYLISEMRVIFRLPNSVQESGLYGNLYAIQGAYNPKAVVTKPNEIVYVANLVGPTAIFTINANWPKSILRLDASQEARLFLLNLEILPWVILGLFLPVLSLVILLILRQKQKKNEQSAPSISKEPPLTISPLLIGVLVDKKIYPKEIVAMLIDLCQRGYLVIVKKSGHYYMGQRKPLDNQLMPWERKILEEVFPLAVSQSTAADLELINKQSLFNPGIKAAFDEVYDHVTQLGLFSENPHRTRVKYKLFALALYYCAVIGAIWLAVTSRSPYLLIPMAATMLISYLIIKLTPQLVEYTDKGLKNRRQWLEFANYLSAQAPIPLEEVQEHLYEKDLPYAIALNKAEAWAKRFDRASIMIVKPDWFISYEEKDVRQFTEEIVAFTASISKLLSQMRGPLVG